MKQLKRIGLWVGAATAAVCLLVLMALIIAPRLANLDVVKNTIINRVSGAMGGDLTYKSVDLHLIPQPRLVLHAAKLSFPEGRELSLTTLRAYPKIIPLLKGQIRFARIEIDQPHIQLRLKTKSTGTEKETAGKPGLKDFRDWLAAILSQPMLSNPGAVYRISQGRLQLSTSGPLDFDFEEINGQILRTEQELIVDVDSRSNVGREISLAGSIQPHDLVATLHLDLKGFQPHLLYAFFYPAGPLQIVESTMDLRADIRTQASRSVRADLSLTDFDCRLQRGGERVEIRGPKALAAVTLAEQSTIFSLTEMQLDAPRMTLAGNLFINPAVPEVDLELSGLGIHIEPLRRTAMVLADSNRSVRQIFNIIVGGHVPVITVSGRGRIPADLRHIENFTIKGRITEGAITIPGPDLNLQQVKGDAAIEKGLLKGSDLQARLEDSQGFEGKLTLGLTGGAAPFHLEIDTQADVAQLQRLLLRLVGNQNFRDELRRIRRIAGSARGRLILGERLDAIKISALVTHASIQADYERIPYPIDISGGRYELTPQRFVVEGIQAAIGRSVLTGVSGELDWQDEMQVKVVTMQSSLDLQELHTWLAALPRFEHYLRKARVTGGIAELSSFDMTTDLPDMRRRRFALSGSLRDGSLATPLTPPSVTIPKGGFSIRTTDDETTRVEIDQWDLRWGASRLGVTGTATVTAGTATFDLDAAADRLVWNQIKTLGDTPRPASRSKSPWNLPLQGRLRLRADSFSYADWIWKPIKAELRLAPNAIAVDIKQADLCGISFPGQIRVAPRGTTLNLSPQAADRDLAPTIACLSQEEGVVTGRYNLSSRLKADTAAAPLIESLKGDLTFTSHSGRIYRYGMLGKILALVNLTEIFKGKLPDIVQDGFAYEDINVTGEFADGKFILQECVINGVSMTIVYNGAFDLVEKTLSLTVLVAPFKTIDSIIKNIPVVSDVLSSRLIAVPFAVTGKWSDYDVKPMSMAEVDRNTRSLIEKKARPSTRANRPIQP